VFSEYEFLNVARGSGLRNWLCWIYFRELKLPRHWT